MSRHLLLKMKCERGNMWRIRSREEKKKGRREDVGVRCWKDGEKYRQWHHTDREMRRAKRLMKARGQQKESSVWSRCLSLALGAYFPLHANLSEAASLPQSAVCNSVSHSTWNHITCLANYCRKCCSPHNNHRETRTKKNHASVAKGDLSRCISRWSLIWFCWRLDEWFEESVWTTEFNLCERDTGAVLHWKVSLLIRWRARQAVTTVV